jgi:cardiolipin synthase
MRRAARIERTARPHLRELADQAFSRAAGAPLIGGNSVKLLRDAGENYPAWLAGIAAARHHVHCEIYFICEDATGSEFAEAFIAKARQGVPVRIVYDWLGSFGKASRRFWDRLRAGGVQVRCFNPMQLDSPLGWLSRDHRKMLEIDGELGFVTGLCIGDIWKGDPARGVDPWRDTGVEMRGGAVADMARAFERNWASLGEPIPQSKPKPQEPRAAAGSVGVRIVASEPATTGLLRLDQMIAALARERLWLTDAYYAGMASYVQALRAAAKDGVDVRLMVPNATDIPWLRPLSRAGYRPLLEAGVRVFEWNGSMLHAKTATADGRWARVGSTNLNVASWLGNCELDAVIEDEGFSHAMEQAYQQDLANATEIVLGPGRKMATRGTRNRGDAPSTARGSAGRAAAGAVRIGRAIGAAVTNGRVLEPIESHLALGAGIALCVAAAVFVFFPKMIAYPVVVLSVWGGLALLYKGFRLRRARSEES